MKLIDVIKRLIAANKQAKKDNKFISSAKVKKVVISFEDDIDLILKPKE